MPFPVIPSHPAQISHPATRIISLASLVEYRFSSLLCFELIEVLLDVLDEIL